MTFILFRIIILLIINILCDTSSYVCDKSSVSCGCGQNPVGINTRIVNGENAIPYSWPMIVSLSNNDSLAGHICGGTILTESYILTAAHCVDIQLADTPDENITVFAGVYNLSQTDKISRKVDKVIIHPYWLEFYPNILYDIAILHLSEPLNLQANSSITRTCLPSRLNTSEEIMQYPSNGTKLVVIGWGQLGTDDPISEILQQLTVNSIHHFDKICTNSIFDPLTQFCAGLYEGGKSICYGDSGGPIFQWTGDRWEQVGIVSYAMRHCAIKGYPGVFTRTAYFYDWIQSHIYNNNQTAISDNQTVDSRILYECYQDRTQCGCSHRNVILSSSTISISENASPYTWSMIVSIRIGIHNQHICSGTILDDFFILTAAHCLINRSVKDITIQAGIYYRSDQNATIRKVDNIYIHPNYTAGSNGFINDIAILHLSVPFSVEDYLNTVPTCFPLFNDQWINTITYPLNGTQLVIAGWDITKISRFSRPEILQQAEIYTIDDENLNCSMSNDQGQVQFCAGRYGIDQKICYGGDFGDPIFKWIDDHWVQVGLASYCRMSDSLGVFTSLASFSSWIQIILNSTVIKSSQVYKCDKKAPCGCGPIDVNLTISGFNTSEDAVKHSWPMMVSIQHLNSHRCGGTILSDSFILTAAGCVSDFSYPYNITVVADVHRLSEILSFSRQVDQIYLHPNYSSGEPDLHDIAILHTDQSFPVDDAPSLFAKTCVSGDNELSVNQYVEVGSQLAVIGWDSDLSTSKISDMLQQIVVKVVNSDHVFCSDSIINNIYQFCAIPLTNNYREKVQYLCEGGSGGPVLIYKNNHWEQVGISPYRTDCTLFTRAEIYTRLSPYLEWIKNVTNSSLTIYPSSIQNNGINKQEPNNFILTIFFLLIVIFL